MTTPRILLVVTSASPVFYSTGQRTGVFWAEAVHPYDVFQAAGFAVDVASETGSCRVDEHSVDADMLSYSHSQDTWQDQQHPMHAILAKPLLTPSTLNPSDYAAIFFTAGHGAMYDFPSTATGLAQLAVALYEQGKPVAAVCHGPAIFELTRTAQGDSIAKGKRITGFAVSGEKQGGWWEQMQQDGVGSCESIARHVGAVWDEPAEPMADYTTQDGLLLTGVNPASAESLARKLVALLQAAKA